MKKRPSMDLNPLPYVYDLLASLVSWLWYFVVCLVHLNIKVFHFVMSLLYAGREMTFALGSKIIMRLTMNKKTDNKAAATKTSVEKSKDVDNSGFIQNAKMFFKTDLPDQIAELIGKLNKKVPQNGGLNSKRYVGLRNQGNTCYLNSLLQCLYHAPKFREKLFTITNKSNKTYSAVNKIFHELDGMSDAVTTHELTESLGLISYKQQDVPEIFHRLLNALDGDTTEGSYFKEVFWSTMVNLMQCKECCAEDGYQTATKIAVLPLAVAPTQDEKQPWSVASALEQFQKINNMTEENQIYCSACRKKTDMILRQTFGRLPPVLVVQLKRFEYRFHSYSFAKLHNEVSIDKTLEVQYDAEKPWEKKSYELFAICDHYGEFWGGHYTAIIKPEGSDKWYRFNDSSVNVDDRYDFSSSRTAYLLMYREQSVRDPDKNKSAPASRGPVDGKGVAAKDHHQCYTLDNADEKYGRGSRDKDLLDSRNSETECSVACIKCRSERPAEQLQEHITSLQLGKLTSQKSVISDLKDSPNKWSSEYQPKKNTNSIQHQGKEGKEYMPTMKQYISKVELGLTHKMSDVSISKRDRREEDVHGYSKKIQYLGGDNLTHSSTEITASGYCQSLKTHGRWTPEHSQDFQPPIHNLKLPGRDPQTKPKEIIPTKKNLNVKVKLICDHAITSHQGWKKDITTDISKAFNPDKYQDRGINETETLMKSLHIHDSHPERPQRIVKTYLPSTYSPFQSSVTHKFIESDPHGFKEKVLEKDSKRVHSLESNRDYSPSRSYPTIIAKECKPNKNSRKRKIPSNRKISPGNKEGNIIKRHCTQATVVNCLYANGKSLQRIPHNPTLHQVHKSPTPEKHEKDNSCRSQRTTTTNTSNRDFNTNKRSHRIDEKQSNPRPPWR